MHFKKLELIGFKSFSDKTIIHFEPGVTAIVGPNGCGKSNISDSIRWVLGEQSAKSLRGSSMEDVIFNGSNLKEPLNLAEVSLTLSNESKILPIEYEEVTITRRLYRSGESEYLLNKNVVRLKDIHELLMGTGIGTESYSIIEQGKMDMILNSKPDERREIFEEAAGITKFKSKKKEALRKIEQTESNLTRIGDIVLEVKRQIGSIERQAKKAENYKIEFEKLKNLELTVASREFLIFEDEKKTRERSLESIKEEENRFLSSMKAFEQNYDEKKRLLSELEESLKTHESQEMAASSDIRRNQDRLLLNRERIGELSARKEQILGQVETAKRRLEEFGAEYEHLNREHEAIHKEEQEGLAFLSSVESEFASIERSIGEALSEEESVKSELFERANRRAHVRNELAKLHAGINALRYGLKKLKHEEDALLNEIREINDVINPPLFNDASKEQPVSFRFEVRLKDFRNKLLAIFRAMVGKQMAEPGPEEEAEMDSEVKTFAEDVVKIHAQVTEHQSRVQHLEVSRKKLEEKLSLLSVETQNLLTEERALSDQEAEHEKALSLIDEEEKNLTVRLASAQELTKVKAKEKESLLIRLAETRSRQGHCTAKREKADKDKNWILESKRNEEAQLVSLENEAQVSSVKKEAIESENGSLDQESQRLSGFRDEILRQTEGARRHRQERLADLDGLEKERAEKMEFLNGARDKMHAFELQSTEIRFEIDRLKDRIFNAYQVDLGSLQTEGPAEINVEEAKLTIQQQREKLNKMGPVNLVAIQEYDEMRERYEFLTKQQEDLIQAKDDLHKAILKINRTTKELFVETFQQIQKHFTEYYKLLFGGGTAELVLLDENDVLESGIEIIARPPGKKLQTISLLSGGEKALTAIALLFSLFKVKPSPFCVLDEIDAPLDESNVDRFCHVLKDFITESQFILITHNKRTMNLADAMYGITMAETGVSKIVSVRFSDKAKHNGKPKDPEEVLV